LQFYCNVGVFTTLVNRDVGHFVETERNQVSAIGEHEFPTTFLLRKTETEKKGSNGKVILNRFVPTQEKRNTLEGSPKCLDEISKNDLTNWNFQKI